ncbi:integral membrane protein [Talaromyces stipitatus ATCC 10500]|uniref:Integral membrane protein n=1 Tax=Talaromyces stipitatus (strain ATCC 10500 / CBS 375.48 / QM 6759 / NRRL 1006) TaxID=441959 RepID=B8MFK0_TALSN|nr:uncharacterized protein TSTA_020480 [Talaromyces stipitatus ATCC 10500]EED16990.1 integral membrane protein [Talaromyces stipitatus ATCC 10500]
MPRKSSSIPKSHFLGHQIDPSLETTRISGPVGFLNPTRVHLKPTRKSKEEEEQEESAQPAISEKEPKKRERVSRRQPRIEYLWRSRDNRKGRHAVHVQYSPKHHGPGHNLPASTNSFREILSNIYRMVTYFPYWDVSWLVATIFTLGSVVWVINAFFVWLPLEDPSTEFSGESLTGGGITAFIGATIFEVGSVLLLLEAVNEKHTACFGWAVETVMKRLESHEDPIKTTVVRRFESNECEHHHAKRHSFLRDGLKETSPEEERSFQWLPSWTELRTHYFHELGFLASLVQLIGATIFWIAGFTGLPGIIDHMSWGLTDGVYWVPQIVGGFCFVLSGFLFTIETQPKWYIPAPSILGWHIGAWNFIGGIGFTLCGALGPASSSSGVEYQTCLATFWGSWAFLIGSVIQWYESVDKFPVEVKSPSLSEVPSDETDV